MDKKKVFARAISITRTAAAPIVQQTMYHSHQCSRALMVLLAAIASATEYVPYSAEEGCDSTTPRTIHIPNMGSGSAILVRSHYGPTYKEGLNCRLALATTPGYKLLIVFERIKLFPECVDSLELSNAQNNPGPLCRFASSGLGRIAIVSLNHKLNLSWTTGHGAKSGKSGFEAVVTAIQDNSMFCPFQQYRCANGLCVADYFACDGHDNCGDNSDEKCQFNMTHTSIFRTALTLLLFSGAIVGAIFVRKKAKASMASDASSDHSAMWPPNYNFRATQDASNYMRFYDNAGGGGRGGVLPRPTTPSDAKYPRQATPLPFQPNTTTNQLQTEGTTNQNSANQETVCASGAPTDMSNDSRNQLSGITQLEMALRQLGVTEIEWVNEGSNTQGTRTDAIPLSQTSSGMDQTLGSIQFFCPQPSSIGMSNLLRGPTTSASPGTIVLESLRPQRMRSPSPMSRGGRGTPSQRGSRPPSTISSRMPMLIIENIGVSSSMEELRDVFRNRSLEDVSPSPPPMTSHSKSLFPTLLLEERRPSPTPTLSPFFRPRSSATPSSRRGMASRNTNSGRRGGFSRQRRVSYDTVDISTTTLDESTQSSTLFDLSNRRQGNSSKRRRSKPRNKKRKKPKRSKDRKSNSAATPSGTSPQLPMIKQAAASVSHQEESFHTVESHEGSLAPVPSPSRYTGHPTSPHEAELSTVPHSLQLSQPETMLFSTPMEIINEKVDEARSFSSSDAGSMRQSPQIFYHFDTFAPPQIYMDLEAKTIKAQKSHNSQQLINLEDNQERLEEPQQTTVRYLFDCINELQDALLDRSQFNTVITKSNQSLVAQALQQPLQNSIADNTTETVATSTQNKVNSMISDLQLAKMNSEANEGNIIEFSESDHDVIQLKSIPETDILMITEPFDSVKRGKSTEDSLL